MMTLDHIALIISKEENLEFYRKLGFKETRRIDRGYDTVVFMENDSLFLEIFVDPKHPARAKNPEAIGLRHFCLTVKKFDELIKQINCEEIKTDWFGRRYVFIKDPDGQPIELIETLRG